MDRESTTELENDGFSQLLADTLKSRPDKETVTASRNSLERNLLTKITTGKPLNATAFWQKPVWKFFALLVIVLMGMLLIFNYRNLTVTPAPQTEQTAEIDTTLKGIDQELSLLQPDEAKLEDFNGEFTQIINQN